MPCRRPCVRLRTSAAHTLLLLAVLREKTECVLENIVRGPQLGIFSLKLADADRLLLCVQRLRGRCISAYAAPKSALGKAINYLLEQWPYLARYPDGRLELSNNRAKRSIKPFVMGRKNWLFANTPGGAQASAVIYSLIETAKENGLDPYRYLLWVLQTAPQLSETDEAWAEKLLPANAPEECYMPQ